MNFFKYLLLMLAASEVTKSATAADPINAIGNNDTEQQPPVLFSPIPLARTLQDSKPLWGVIHAESIQHKLNSDVIMKLIEISNPEVNIASSRTAKDKISFFEKGAQYTPTEKTHQKNTNLSNRGLSGSSEIAKQIDQILLESPNGHAVLSINTESKTIISGKIEERDETNFVTIYVIERSDDPADQSYKITIIDREAQSARTDNPDEETELALEIAPDHGRNLAKIPPIFQSGTPPKPGETRVFTMRIYYGEDAVNAVGGMNKAQAHAGQVITDINFYLKNSGIKDWMQLKLKDAVISPVSETSDSYDDLINASGFERDGADFIMYIVDSLGSCGRAYVYGAYYPTPESLKQRLTSVVKLSCSLTDRSAAHELGHNLAALHDTRNEVPLIYEGVEIFPYARALADEYNYRGSILAHVRIKSDRYPFYSSATGVYNGIKMGSAYVDNSRAIKEMLQVAHYILHGGETAPPTTEQAIPSKKPTTAAATNSPIAATKRPTLPTKRPTAGTKRPTISTYRPTKRPTKAPTKKIVTAAPTFDQTPTMKEKSKVRFSLTIPKKNAKPLILMIGNSRKIIMSTTEFSITNSKGGNIDIDKFKPTAIEIKKILKTLLAPGNTCQFEIHNTNDNVEIYYLSPPTKKNGKTIPGAVKLLLTLEKKSGKDVFIDDNVTIKTDGTPANLRFSAVTPINQAGRMLDAPVQEQDKKIGQINFIEIERSHEPETEGQKLAQKDELMKLIASDWQTLYKFMVDSIVSLGPYDANKFFRSGVIQKLFSHASEENICGAITLMSNDTALMALCKDYVPANIDLDDETMAILETYKKFKTEYPIPLFIRDIGEAKLVSKSAAKMAIILRLDANLNTDDSAIVDMFKFAAIADIKVLEQLFTDVHTTKEQRNNYISFVSKETIEKSPALKEIANSAQLPPIKKNLRNV